MDFLRGLLGQVAIVTGAGRGMARAHAELLAEQGIKVVAHDLVEAGAKTGLAWKHGITKATLHTLLHRRRTA